MRVLVTTDYYPPHYGGGAEATLPVVIRWLAERGHAVEVITLNTQNAKGVEERDGAVVYRVGTWPLERVTGLQFSLSPSLPAFTLRRLWQFQPNIVWAHNHFFTTSLAAHWAAQWTHIPVLTDLSLADVRHLTLPQKLLALGWERIFSKWMLRHSAILTGVSQACIDHGKQLLGRKVVPAVVVPNGVDTSAFHPAEKASRPVSVGFVGRLIRNKGPQRLLAAIPHVLSEHPEVRFVFIGDGPMKATLQSQAEDLGVSRAVDFLGRLAHERIPETLRSVDIVVRPSDTEGLPVAVLESLATGIPVIATDVGGTREIVHHEVTGLLLPPKPAPTEIACAILSLVYDEKKRTQLGQAARKSSEALDWRHCVGLREEVLLQYARADGPVKNQ
jgi:glycosyltransferase involved in cell wall biosynthesis